MSLAGAGPPAWRRGPAVAVLVLALGLGLLLAAALGGHYFFLPKALALPMLALVALLSGRTRAFLRDWLMFLVLLLLFDSLRGAIYVAIFKWQLPWYLGYAIRLEELIFGVPSVPHWLRESFPALFESEPLRALMVIVHASHFVYFLGIGCLVYTLRPEAFGRFKAVMVGTMFGGLAGYLLVPTVPPWMAGDFFDVLPPIERVIVLTYNTYVPTLFAGFQTNYIAAMPSLHAAFPTACAAIAGRLFGWRAWPIFAYTVLTFLSPIYLGEHYAVDLLAGAVLGLAVYLPVFHIARFGPAEAAAEVPAGRGRFAALIAYIGPRRCLASFAVFYVAVLLGFTNRGERMPGLLPDQRFIERELAGRSNLVAFFAGARALRDGRQEEARRLLAQGLAEPAVGRDDFVGCRLLLKVAREVHALPLLADVLQASPVALSSPYGRDVLEEARRGAAR